MGSLPQEPRDKRVPVSQYLFQRLHEVGVRSVHGLPGDYNLVALDYLLKSGLNWVGSVNELNAAYAADGYARVNGMGALLTTFGVGELSAINGTAGAYSEHIPVVHIVGCPSTKSQRDGMLLHHTLGNGDFDVFANMSAPISCNVAKLVHPPDIAVQIDHALRECWIKSRPVYIMLPSDMAEAPIDGARLETPIDLSEPANDPEQEDYVVDVALKYLNAAEKPVILVDACAVRHRVLDEVHALIDRANIPVFVTPMGKSGVNEQHPNYVGVYAGSGSHPDVKKAVESADLVLAIGGLKSDFNTTGFSDQTSQLNTINLHSDHCVVRYSTYPGVSMRGVLVKLANLISPHPTWKDGQVIDRLQHEAATDKPEAVIEHAWLWPRVGEFLRPNDVVVTETGTANFGIWDTKFPKDVTAMSQVLWGSIGWSVGACQGAALAAKEAGGRRTILFVGDGSFQLSAQEVSTMLRHNLPVIIFVICNNGFTIERCIHGETALYNDIRNWDNKKLLDVFQAGEETRRVVVKNRGELNALVAEEEFINPRGLTFVEMHMPEMDAPCSLVLTAECCAKRNAKVQ